MMIRWCVLMRTTSRLRLRLLLLLLLASHTVSASLHSQQTTNDDEILTFGRHNNQQQQIHSKTVEEVVNQEIESAHTSTGAPLYPSPQTSPFFPNVVTHPIPHARHNSSRHAKKIKQQTTGAQTYTQQQTTQQQQQQQQSNMMNGGVPPFASSPTSSPPPLAMPARIFADVENGVDSINHHLLWSYRQLRHFTLLTSLLLIVLGSILWVYGSKLYAHAPFGCCCMILTLFGLYFCNMFISVWSSEGGMDLTTIEGALSFLFLFSFVASLCVAAAVVVWREPTKQAPRVLSIVWGLLCASVVQTVLVVRLVSGDTYTLANTIHITFMLTCAACCTASWVHMAKCEKPALVLTTAGCGSWALVRGTIMLILMIEIGSQGGAPLNDDGTQVREMNKEWKYPNEWNPPLVDLQHEDRVTAYDALSSDPSYSSTLPYSQLAASVTQDEIVLNIQAAYYGYMVVIVCLFVVGIVVQTIKPTRPLVNAVGLSSARESFSMRGGGIGSSMRGGAAGRGRGGAMGNRSLSTQSLLHQSQKHAATMNRTQSFASYGSTNRSMSEERAAATMIFDLEKGYGGFAPLSKPSALRKFTALQSSDPMLSTMNPAHVVTPLPQPALGRSISSPAAQTTDWSLRQASYSNVSDSSPNPSPSPPSQTIIAFPAAAAGESASLSASSSAPRASTPPASGNRSPLLGTPQRPKPLTILSNNTQSRLKSGRSGSGSGPSGSGGGGSAKEGGDSGRGTNLLLSATTPGGTTSIVAGSHRSNRKSLTFQDEQGKIPVSLSRTPDSPNAFIAAFKANAARFATTPIMSPASALARSTSPTTNYVVNTTGNKTASPLKSAMSKKNRNRGSGTGTPASGNTPSSGSSSTSSQPTTPSSSHSITTMAAADSTLPSSAVAIDTDNRLPPSDTVLVDMERAEEKM